MPEDVMIDRIEKAIQRQFEHRDQEERRRISEKCYTINAVAKRLGRNHSTIKKMVRSGLIKSTKNGLITEVAINDYLQNK
jgi:IS30 family transposase